MKTRLTMNVLAAAITMAAISTTTLANSKMDSEIENAANHSYVFKTLLKHDDIRVEVNAGVATLKGSVNEESHKALAEETVANLPGVTSVDNKLQLKGKHPTEKSDEWLVARVKSTLLFHSNVSALTEVTAANGVVTLHGPADNQAQMDLTAEYAADVEGVKEVKNMMTVVASSPKTAKPPGDKIDDASITAEVKLTLLSHRSTSAVRTKVTTKDGVVTVNGNAKNAAEISLVTKLVSDINGVSKVNNQMTAKQD